MTLTLRQSSDARATTKGSALTYAEMDANFLHALDEGTIVVGDDSSGSTIKLGDTLKIAGGTNVTTAMSGNTLTITGIADTVVADTSPQLGGNLDVQTNSIVTTSDRDLKLAPNGTGKVLVGPGTESGKISSSGAHDLELSTNDGTSSGFITITDGGNGNITVAPQGSGLVVVGNDTTKAQITSNTDQDIEIMTNSGTNSGKIIITDGANGDISLTPNGTGEIKLGSGSASAKITSNGAHDMVINTNEGTNSGNITIVDGSNGNIELDPNGSGEIVLGNGSQAAKITTNGIQDMIFDTNAGTDTPQFAIRTGQHANDSAPDKGILEFDAKGIGGAVFINNEDPQAYPTGAMILRNNGANDAEIHFGQFGQGPAVGKSGDNTLFFSVYFDPDAKAYSHSDSTSFPGDANVFFGFDYDNNQAIMQGNGGSGGFRIDTFGNNSASYASGPIKLVGSYVEIDSGDKYVEFKNRSGDPSTPSGAAIQYAKGGEMFVKDASGNVTQISPHNDQGEWEYFSRNTETGKTVKVNMEKMIRKLEQITGETFFEEFTPARS